jgi:hypothetical protein
MDSLVNQAQAVCQLFCMGAIANRDVGTFAVLSSHANAGEIIGSGNPKKLPLPMRDGLATLRPRIHTGLIYGLP